MFGAIAGEVIGSLFHPVTGNWDAFPLFSAKSRSTDDTVMTVAVADGLMNADDWSHLQVVLVDSFHAYRKACPKAGYGMKFMQWLMFGNREPYNSYGNGSAMRLPPWAGPPEV